MIYHIGNTHYTNTTAHIYMILYDIHPTYSNKQYTNSTTDYCLYIHTSAYFFDNLIVIMI